MEIEAIDPNSGKVFVKDAPMLDEKTINEHFNEHNKSSTKIKRWINELNISSDAKAILFKIAYTTFRAGDVVVRIGLKILDIISYILKKYSNASFGLVFGFFVGTLATTIPIIGILIGPFVVALGAIIGGVMGYREDLLDKKVKRTIQEAMIDFNKLQTG